VQGDRPADGTVGTRWRRAGACHTRGSMSPKRNSSGSVRPGGAVASGTAGRRGGPDVEAVATPRGGVDGRTLARGCAARCDTGRVISCLHLFSQKFKPNSRSFEYQSCRATIGEHFFVKADLCFHQWFEHELQAKLMSFMAQVNSVKLQWTEIFTNFHSVGDRPRGPLKQWGNPHLNPRI
jgi:hypothetical protein